MMGIWSSTLFGSGGALQWNRWQGTLELLVAAPPPFVVVLLPLTLATSVTGAYALVATLLWGRIFFGVPLHFAHPAAFVVAVPAAVLSLGLMGLLMASSFVLYRHANALSNLLEYPVWLATGLLFPVALLPGWVTPLSWVLAPTWGIRAIRHAALGGGAVWFPIVMCVAARQRLPRPRRPVPPDLRERSPRPRNPLSDMTGTNPRIFFVGGMISFRALFNWIKPWIYIPTMLGSPLFQILFFAYLGRYALPRQSDAFFVVGNAVQVCAMSARLRDDDGGRQRAAVRDARAAARLPGEPARRVPRPRRARARERARRVRLRLHRRSRLPRLPPRRGARFRRWR